MATAEERVDKGIEFISKINPNWYEDINTKTLNLSHTDHCLLGQSVTAVNKDFYDYFDVNTDWGYDYGLHCHSDMEKSELTAIWKKKILVARNGVVSKPNLNLKDRIDRAIELTKEIEAATLHLTKLKSQLEELYDVSTLD